MKFESPPLHRAIVAAEFMHLTYVRCVSIVRPEVLARGRKRGGTHAVHIHCWLAPCTCMAAEHVIEFRIEGRLVWSLAYKHVG